MCGGRRDSVHEPQRSEDYPKKRRNIEMNEIQLPATDARTIQFEKLLKSFVIFIAVMSICPIFAIGQMQEEHSHTTLSTSNQSQQGALIKAVREATARYQNVRSA